MLLQLAIGFSARKHVLNLAYSMYTFIDMTDDEKKAYNQFRSTINLASFNNLPYVRRIEKPWGYELHFVPDGLPYMGKLMHINPSCRQSLQVHDNKTETYILIAGTGGVIIEDSKGSLEDVYFKENLGYTTKIGQKHRLFAGKEPADIIEFSMPEKGITYRLEDDYDRPSETEELRAKRNRDGKN